MNVLEHVITKILVPPYQHIDDEYCCWEVKVEYDCWGATGTRTIRATTKSAIDSWKVGSSWEG